MCRKYFQEVYPFTTEMISGYFKEIDFKDKSVLTVGSSSDQAFNALLMGAKSIKVYDINEDSAKFGKLKRDIIINSPRDDVYTNVLNNKEVKMSFDRYPKYCMMQMNSYMQNEENFKKCKIF